MVWTLIISGMSIQAPHHTCVATRICSKRSISNIKLTFLWQMDKRYRPQELAIFFSSAQNMMGLITWPSYVMCSMYVPQLCGNVISVKKLVEKGLEVHFKGKFCRIIKNGETLAEAIEHKGLFALNVSQKLLKVIEGHKVKYKAECIHVWHNRMGHRDQQAIRLLERQTKASGINIKPCQFSTVCECCIQSKMTRKPFPKKSESKTDEILDLIHTDVCGPMQTTTPGGKVFHDHD